MELKATAMGKRLAQHPYNRVRLLTAGVEVSGDRHEYLIPFNQLLDISCKRGLVWGELEFLLAENQVVRLHGTEWQETQRFYHYLQHAWQQWSAEMSHISTGVLDELLQQELSQLLTPQGALHFPPLQSMSWLLSWPGLTRRLRHCRCRWRAWRRWITVVNAGIAAGSGWSRAKPQFASVTVAGASR